MKAGKTILSVLPKAGMPEGEGFSVRWSSGGWVGGCEALQQIDNRIIVLDKNNSAGNV